jgi:serine O-acetyltransferase
MRGGVPKFQVFFRKAQEARNPIFKLIYKMLFVRYRNKNHIELSIETEIGEGLYIGHPYCITINYRAKIGKNVNIHKGVTIGQENRGDRQGVPSISDEVWIGINSTIVGAVHIENDVLIAPNSYVNCDIPAHSVVFGNPCIIKHRDNATEGYINRKV